MASAEIAVCAFGHLLTRQEVPLRDGTYVGYGHVNEAEAVSCERFKREGWPEDVGTPYPSG